MVVILIISLHNALWFLRRYFWKEPRLTGPTWILRHQAGHFAELILFNLALILWGTLLTKEKTKARRVTDIRSMSNAKMHTLPRCLQPATSEASPRKIKMLTKLAGNTGIAGALCYQERGGNIKTWSLHSHGWPHPIGLHQGTLGLVVPAPHWGQQNCKSPSCSFESFELKTCFWATVKVTTQLKITNWATFSDCWHGQL